MTESLFEEDEAASPESVADSYRQLADIFRTLLEEQEVGRVLDRIADRLAELIPYDSLTIYEADEAHQTLTPVVARDQWAEEIMNSIGTFRTGITGWAVLHREPVLTNDARLDPRAEQVPGTPEEQESLICVPLVSRGKIKGALNIYRVGSQASFSHAEFELGKRFADVAALALDNAQIRVALEHQAQTDSLTGLFNHRFFHERLRAELTRASRSRDSVALLVLDLDDFKRVNDIHGHGVGDHVLVGLAEIMNQTVRASDVACRIGGEEFAVIMPSCDVLAAHGLAARLNEELDKANFEPAGKMTVSVGIAQGPLHAMNPRELVACAEAAMMTAKAHGKNRVVVFDEELGARPKVGPSDKRDVRSIAHLKMLQSLAGKLNRLNDVRQIGMAIAQELRTLIDYHNCRVYIAEDDWLVPIAFQGSMQDYVQESVDVLKCRFGEGITGRVAETAAPLLIPNALDVDFAVTVPGTSDIEESMLVVPLTYGVRVIGVIAISKLGVNQFDDDDARLLEVLAGHASVALENARLYEAQLREATHAKALLEFADAATRAHSYHEIGDETVRMAAKLLELEQSALWLQDERSGDFRCVAHEGYVGDREAEPLVHERWSREIGEAFLGDNREPFILTPAEKLELLPIPPGARPSEVAVAPVNPGNDLKGWISVRPPGGRKDHFSDERMIMLAGLASHASMALQKALLYKDQKQSAEIAKALLDFGRELAAARGAEAVLDRIVELSARILGAPSCSVWLQDASGGEMRAEAVWGYAGKKREQMLGARFPEMLSQAFLTLSAPFVLEPSQYDAIPGARVLSNTPTAVAPLKLDGGRLGAIAVGAPALGGYEFSERKMKLLEGIAHQAALAINNALSFESLEQTFLDTVEALANALEAKDEYTSSHARWITDTSLQVGRTLGMENQALKRLELGALFHDIGKIGIPSDILLKPGPLNEHEWGIIRMHPELGERILAPIARLADVRPIVRACHEHFDGSGYPDGKRGDEIPLESRIILVVDAFHAMTTDRPYRKRLSVGEASRRLSASSGTQFDPKVVDAFLRLVDERPEVAETA
ncbi:MAG TPA: GAF domain-containing protein [Actinomycetota bacterium]|nr:GAF domain-containing protein [Actinomycetota bacterium]